MNKNFIYECKLTLMESLFFCSKEIDELYITDEVIGNYALAYALGFIKSPYLSEADKLLYSDEEHLPKLNKIGIYITPANFIGKVRKKIEIFNSTTDSYFMQVIQGGFRTEFLDKTDKTGKSNRPQKGRIQLLCSENQAIFYIISKKDISNQENNSNLDFNIPSYIRLGKFMSKAKIEFKDVDYKEINSEKAFISQLLNSIDIPISEDKYAILNFDMVARKPVPLLQNITLQSKGTPFYKFKNFLGKESFLPVDMKFNYLPFLEKKGNKKNAK